MELSKDYRIEFERKDNTKAMVFPTGPPTVGYRFVKETNGWKITVEGVANLPWL